VPVSGGVITNDGGLRIRLAEAGMGLAYVPEPSVADAIAAGQLVRVLQAYAPLVPVFFLYYPSRAQRSPALRAFVETARELASTRVRGAREAAEPS
jgi:DNA-binding transcriptional LysR family regulator